MTRTLPLAALVGLSYLGLVAAQEPPTGEQAAAPAASPAGEEAAHEVAWLTSLDEARERARVRRAPILVVFGATWCGPCKALDEELRRTEVQEQLENWLPVHVDVDEHPLLARDMGVSSIPNLTVLTPDGNVVMTQVGALSAPVLAAWLRSSLADARQDVPAELLARGAPGLLDVSRIVREFRRRDSTLREAAINRLRGYPEAAAAVVVSRFVRGNLSERLASRELLEGWGAPVAELDPWSPDSLTAERVALLDEWLTAKNFATADNPDALSAQATLEAQRLIRAMTQADAAGAAALREQLARLGPEVMPFLREALTGDLSDHERSRLIAARYRLVSAPELVVRWPGGLERLASGVLAERAAAANELAALATPEDEPLLLELFSDPAPLIREISLKSLQQADGAGPNSALIRLLDDPDDNVRVAVLKQLSESPPATLVPAIAAYLDKESNPDLLVHTARLLREIATQGSLEALGTLFRHASWRVRSEAVASVNYLLSANRELATVNHAALEEQYIQLLGDEDPFVISRALQGLETIGRGPAVAPMLAVTGKHPELTSEVVRVLTESSYLQADAQEPLRSFARHERPNVRAASLAGLATLSGAEAAEFLRDGLRDSAPEVRTVAADAVFDQTSKWLSSRIALAGQVVESEPAAGGGVMQQLFNSFFGGGTAPAAPAVENGVPNENAAADADSPDANPVDLMLVSIRTEGSFPAWLRDLQTDLAPLLADADPAARFAGARALTVLGRPEALPVLREGIADRAAMQKAAQALPLIPFAERVELFRRLIETARAADDRIAVSYYFASQPHPLAAAELWLLLEKYGGERQLAAGLVERLLQSYLDDDYYFPERASPLKKARLVRDAAKFATGDHAAQRDVALALLAQVEPAKAVEIAAPLFARDDLDPAVRLSAFQVLLACDEKQASEVRAAEALQSGNRDLAGPALSFLALGDKSITTLSGGISLRSTYSSYSYLSSGNSGTPQVFAPPAGVTADLLRPLLAGEAPQPAQAGYLLALLEEPDGLPPLLAQWRSDPRHAEYRRLAYRAIAQLNDDRHMAVLEDIYRALVAEEAQSEIKDFYWTIRVMSGPRALELRQKIRTEQGADVLR